MPSIYIIRKSSGFTLIEVLLIAPIIILLIGVFISLIVNLTGESLVQREKNSVLYETNNALDDIEQAVGRSASFLETTPDMPTPQGKNNINERYLADNPTTADTLILLSPSTNENPFSPSRSLISLGTGACDASKILHYYYTIYFIANNSLYKRTVVPLAGTKCAQPWQRNSCSAATMTDPRCVAEDEILADGVVDTEAGLKVEYFQVNGTTAATASEAKKATVTLSTSRQAAGETVSSSASVQVTRISSSPFEAGGVVDPS